MFWLGFAIATAYLLCAPFNPCWLQILADEITADFYLAEPDMVQKLLALKNKLRKKFPKSKRGQWASQGSGMFY